MSHSVLVLSNGADFVRDGIFKTDRALETITFRARAYFMDMIAKEEKERDGTVAIYLNENFCALKRADGYAIYVCLGEFHMSGPLLTLPLDAVIRAEGDHEFECHHRELPIM